VVIDIWQDYKELTKKETPYQKLKLPLQASRNYRRSKSLLVHLRMI